MYKFNMIQSIKIYTKNWQNWYKTDRREINELNLSIYWFLTYSILMSFKYVSPGRLCLLWRMNISIRALFTGKNDLGHNEKIHICLSHLLTSGYGTLVFFFFSLEFGFFKKFFPKNESELALVLIKGPRQGVLGGLRKLEGR